MPEALQTVAHGITLVDVEHLGMSRVIAAALLTGRGEPALVDPGPTSSLPTLEAKLQRVGVSLGDIRAILLTHIHLDHAGATGTLVRDHPDLKVYVHERGAPHVVDPAKLLHSATRLYGGEMQRLWGDVLPVPAAHVHPLTGGERLEVSGRELRVAYTPGHASHHVSYLDTSNGTAFVGDVAGIRISGKDAIFPPTPPPDIDLDLWSASLDALADWAPERLFLTHFGVTTEPPAHVAALRERLTEYAELVRRGLESGASEDEQARAFTRRVAERLRRELPDDEAARFESAAGPVLCWYGLARYWSKKLKG